MIGKEVRRRREELGLTSAQLAERAGMAPSAVSQIETGRRTPNSTSVMKLAAALEVEVGDLFPKGQSPLPFEEGERRFGDNVTSLQDQKDWEAAFKALGNHPGIIEKVANEHPELLGEINGWIEEQQGRSA